MLRSYLELDGRGQGAGVKRISALCAALLAVSASLSGCGDESHLVVQLRTLGSEDPFAGVATLQATVQRGEVVLARESVVFDGRPFELPAADVTGAVEIFIEGLDDGDAMLARGRAAPDVPAEGAACCVHVCFCTVASFEAGACGCGSNACEPLCVP